MNPIERGLYDVGPLVASWVFEIYRMWAMMSSKVDTSNSFLADSGCPSSLCMLVIHHGLRKRWTRQWTHWLFFLDTWARSLNFAFDILLIAFEILITWLISESAYLYYIWIYRIYLHDDCVCVLISRICFTLLVLFFCLNVVLCDQKLCQGSVLERSLAGNLWQLQDVRTTLAEGFDVLDWMGGWCGWRMVLGS